MRPLVSSSAPLVILPHLFIFYLIISVTFECSLLSLMTIKGGTSQACAACKYQRRRCSKECVLASYFPAHETQKFQNAHRLFGVRNIMKILSQVHPQQREQAMTSIIFESDVRAKFPVQGCSGIITQLYNQLQATIEELRYVNDYINICKEQCQNINILPSTTNYHEFSLDPQLHLGMSTKNNGEFPNIYEQQQHHHHQYINYGVEVMPILMPNDQFVTNEMNGHYIEEDLNNMARSLRVPNICYGINGYNNIEESAANNLMIETHQVGCSIQQELDVSHDENIPFDTIADDRQSFIESKEISCDQSSAESSFKNITQNIEPILNRELKTAAACFTLTSLTPKG